MTSGPVMPDLAGQDLVTFVSRSSPYIVAGGVEDPIQFRDEWSKYRFLVEMESVVDEPFPNELVDALESLKDWFEFVQVKQRCSEQS